MQLDDDLLPILVMLRAAYPEGLLPNEEYRALLVVLQEDLPEYPLGQVVAEFMNEEAVVVINDAAAAASILRPTEDEVQRVRLKLVANGWEPLA